METVTQAQAPWRWVGPSVLISTAHGDRTVLATSGWFSRLLAWEERFPGAVQEVEQYGISFSCVGDYSLLNHFPPAKVLQIEIVLDTFGIDEKTMSLLRGLVPGEIIEELARLPDHDEVTVNANRDAARPHSWTNIDACFVDIPVNTLPSTRGGVLAIISATRWARVIRWSHGLLILWSPVSGYWEEAQVRWPHHGIPSRSQNALDGMLNSKSGLDERILVWFQEVVAHEKYFLDTWANELEHWETRLFHQLADGESTYAALELPPLQRDIGVLAGYLDRVRTSERFFLRRAEVSSLVGKVTNLPELFMLTQAELKTELRQSRDSLRSAIDLLSSVSQGAQAYAAAESQKTQERLNTLITTVTSVLFVPSLVAAVFGANIRELSPESRGTLPQLLGLMIAISMVSMGALRCVRQGRVGLSSAFLLCLGFTTSVSIILWRNLLVATIPVGILALSFSIIGAVFFRRRKG